MRILKFKSQLTIAFFAAVNHLNGPLGKQNFTLTGSKGQGLWFVIGGFRSVLCVSVGAFHLVKVSGISGSAVNGTRFVGSSHWKIPRKSGRSKQVVPFSRLEFPNGMSCPIYVSCSLYQFQVRGRAAGHVPWFTTKWNNFLPIGNSTFATTEISGFFRKWKAPCVSRFAVCDRNYDWRQRKTQLWRRLLNFRVRMFVKSAVRSGQLGTQLKQLQK